ncbi:hypothetical protein ID866_13017, partial [Astraeus odoratus]
WWASSNCCCQSWLRLWVPWSQEEPRGPLKVQRSCRSCEEKGQEYWRVSWKMHWGMNQKMMQGQKMAQRRKANRARPKARARKRPFSYQIQGLSSR